VDEVSLPRLAPGLLSHDRNAPLDWSASFEFRSETLRRFNPLPFLLQLLQEVPGLRPRVGALHTVLVELYSNALEHGVLQLDSSLKRDACGFAHYYGERRSRLERLREGHVRFHLGVWPEPGGGRLTLEVEDSGSGFDPSATLGAQHRGDRFSGRGLTLVRNLADRCEWRQDGRGIRVEFAWRDQA
jgi:anti-sigma regulatory factor (Ser/Thr protein kinase)